MLPPFSVGFVKGWRRSLAMLIICEGIRSIGIDLADVDSLFKEICGILCPFFAFQLSSSKGIQSDDVESKNIIMVSRFVAVSECQLEICRSGLAWYMPQLVSMTHRKQRFGQTEACCFRSPFCCDFEACDC